MSDNINKRKNSKYSMNKKSKKFNRGFIVAMTVCLVAIGAASISTYRNIKDYIDPPADITTISSDTEKASDDINVNQNLNGILDTDSVISLPPVVVATDTDSDKIIDHTSSDTAQNHHISLNGGTDTESESDLESESDTDTIISETFLYPVGHDVIKEYSGDSLVYSETMDDWRVHLGTDFYAEKGTKVKPMTNGTVTNVYSDALLGVTVVIDHGNSVSAYYSGLGSTVLVNVGDTVSASDYIGSINVVPSESLDKPHLHLAVRVNEEWVNPMEIIQQ